MATCIKVGYCCAARMCVNFKSTRMVRSDSQSGVIDLAAYRARRAGQCDSARAVRYLLWYPGFGLFARATPTVGRGTQPERLKAR
jgi:hypothetical protein